MASSIARSNHTGRGEPATTTQPKSQHAIVVLPLAAMFLLSFFVPGQCDATQLLVGSLGGITVASGLLLDLQSSITTVPAWLFLAANVSLLLAFCHMVAGHVSSTVVATLFAAGFFTLAFLSAILFVFLTIIIVPLASASRSPGLPALLWSSSLIG